MTVGRWQFPPGQANPQLYVWAQNLMRQFIREEYKDYHLQDVTLSAGTTTAVAWDGMSADHRVFVTPSNSAAAALAPYVSAITAGTGFTLTHGTAAGTETYHCLIIK